MGEKVQKDMQQLGDPSAFQREQHHWNYCHGPQGQGQQTSTRKAMDLKVNPLKTSFLAAVQVWTENC